MIPTRTKEESSYGIATFTGAPRARFPLRGTGLKLAPALLPLSCVAASGLAHKNGARVVVDETAKVEGGLVFKEGDLKFEQVAPEKIVPVPKGAGGI